MFCVYISRMRTTTEKPASVHIRAKSPTFGLRPRPLRFAKLMATEAGLSASECARRAGYARHTPAAANPRAVELQRDPRVIRAILHFGAIALAKARARAISRLNSIERRTGRHWIAWDRTAWDRLTLELQNLETHTERLERIYVYGLKIGDEEWAWQGEQKSRKEKRRRGRHRLIAAQHVARADATEMTADDALAIVGVCNTLEATPPGQATIRDLVKVLRTIRKVRAPKVVPTAA